MLEITVDTQLDPHFPVTSFVGLLEELDTVFMTY